MGHCNWTTSAHLHGCTLLAYSPWCLSQGLPGQGDLAGSICIYYDEVQPGNVLRPDKGRSFLA
eukprot:7005419-Lingulodinium_polyedra.AAC.1